MGPLLCSLLEHSAALFPEELSQYNPFPLNLVLRQQQASTGPRDERCSAGTGLAKQRPWYFLLVYLNHSILHHHRRRCQHCSHHHQTPWTLLSQDPRLKRPVSEFPRCTHDWDYALFFLNGTSIHCRGGGHPFTAEWTTIMRNKGFHLKTQHSAQSGNWNHSLAIRSTTLLPIRLCTFWLVPPIILPQWQKYWSISF